MTEPAYTFAAVQRGHLPAGDGSLQDVLVAEVMHAGRVVGSVTIMLSPRHGGTRHGFGVNVDAVCWDEDLAPRGMGFDTDNDGNPG